jgi:membrane-associated protein
METLRTIFLAIGWWTYVLVGLDLLLESSAFLGVILPGDTIVILMGVLVGGGIFSMWVSLVIIISCVFVGDTSGYLLGRYKGESILKKSPWIKHHYDETNDRIVRYKQRFGAWIVLIGRFLPVIRTVTPFSMGMAGMKLLKFVAVALLTSIIWGAGWFFLGWAFGRNWRALESILRPVGFGVAGLYVIVIVASFGWHNRERGKILWRNVKRAMARRHLIERP